MNPKLKYFWSFFVFFVFVYYFHELSKKSQRTIHTTISEKFEENPSILFCVSLKDNCNNKFKKNGNFKTSKIKKKTMKNLICHLNKNIQKNPKLIIKEAKKWNFFDAFESEKNDTLKKTILMHNYYLCANYDLILNLNKNIHIFSFNLNQINLKVFVYPSNKINLFFGLKLFTFNFSEKEKYISKLFINQIKIHNLDYEKNCLKKKKKNVIKKCSKIYCYQHCFKNKKNSYRFLYTEEDDILLNIDNRKTNPVDEKRLEKCFEEFHGYYYFIKETKFENTRTQKVNFIFDSYITKIKPQYLINNHLFFLEVSSLLSVLLGFNYLDFLLNCLSVLVRIIKLNKKILEKKIEVFIFIFVTISLLLNCLDLIKFYYKFPLVNTTTSYYPDNSIQFSFSPCFNVETILDRNTKRSLKILKKPVEKNNIFFLEKHTLKYKSLINQSHINFISKYEKIKLNKKKIKVFYMSEWKLNDTKLNVYKCYFITINITQSHIRNLLGSSFIELNFNKLISFYYLSDINSYPHSKTKKIYSNSKYKIFETILEGDPSIFNCKNYENKCFSQRSCIDYCFINRYINNFYKLPTDTPIFFKKYKLMLFNYLSFHLNSSKNLIESEKMKKLCIASYPLVDCYQKKFYPLDKQSKKKTKKVSFFLHDIIKSDSEVVLMNKYEFILNVITSINVWLGLNLPKLIKNLLLKINRQVSKKFKYGFLQNSYFNRIFQTLFNLAVFLGLSYHLFFAINGLVKQNKVTSVKYKILSKIEYPFLIFCLDYEKKNKLIQNQKLSGKLLDQITFSANDVFESIAYLDNDFKLKTQLDLNSLETIKSNGVFKLSHFYFMKFKCFKLKNKIKIPFYYFYRNENDSNFLTVNFKPNVTEYYFTLGTKKILNFNHFKKLKKQDTVIDFFRITVQYQDLYVFFKNFFHFFKREKSVVFNEGVSFTKFVKKKFQEYKNYSTLMLPLNKKYFNLPINDQEFIKFYKTKIVKLEKENVDKSYYADYFIRIYSSLEQSKNNRLKFKPRLLASETTITDKIEIENFLLAVMNIVSFWLNFNLMKIFEYLKIFNIKLA